MSLRSRLLFAFGVVAAMLVLADLVLASQVDNFLLRQVDGRLASAMPTVSRTRGSGLPGGGGNPGPPGGPSRVPSGREGEPPVGLTDLYIETRDVEGNVVDQVSPGFRDHPDPPPRLDALTVKAHARRESVPAAPFTVLSVDGTVHYRVGVEEEPDRRGYTVVALSLREMDATSRQVLYGAGGVTAAVIVVLAIVAGWVFRLGVRPLGRMAGTAEAIAAGDLSRRAEVTGGTRTEVGRLGTAFNTMLAEIQEAFAAREQSETRLRRFVADASHELRTPLTSIRGYAELYRQGGLQEAGALDDAMRRVEQEAIRMGTMVEDLLVLARLDQGRPLEKARVDLALIVADAVADARAVEPDRPITLESESSVVVVADENRLRQVTANLLGNVRGHTPPGAAAQVRVSRRDGWARLEVADEGPGIDPAERDRVFERFFRSDPSRARRSGGSGLGLSIVAAIAEAHGGRVSVGPSEAGGASILVELPLDGQHL